MRTALHQRTAATLLSLSLAWICPFRCAGQPLAPELASPCRVYSLRMTSYVPAPARVEGLLLKASVNGGPLLRLLLDTGAAHVVLSRAAAARSGFSPTSNLTLVGFGALPAADVKSGMARTIEIGALKLRNYPVDMAPDRLPEGLDGVFLKSSTHPRAFGNFARVYARYVREDKLLNVSEAVRKMTSLPAANLGIARRGMLKPDYFADVVVFDPAAIQDHATFEQPRQLATGVSEVFVNGVQVVHGGQHTGAKPGRVVRRDRQTPAA